VLKVRSKAVRGLVAGLVVGLAAAVAGRAAPLRRLELLSVDARMRLASPAEAPPVAVIGITQEDVRERGPLPWSRRDYAKAVAKLHRLGAHVIVFDLYFSRPSATPDEDIALAEAIREAGNVVLPSYAKVDPRERYGRLESGVRWLTLPSDEYLERNVPVLRSAVHRQGHINLSAHDPDHLFRRVPVAIGFRDSNEVFYALSVEAAAAALLEERDGPAPSMGGLPSARCPPVPDIRVSGDHLYIGERRWPLDPDFPGCLPIDFSGVGRKVDVYAGRWRAPWGPHRSIFLYSFSEFMRGDFPKRAVAGRIVFVGSLLYERHPDVHPTPVGQQPGVIIHALGTQTLLGARYPHWLSPAGQVGVTAGLLVLVALGCFVLRFRWSLVLLAGTILGVAGAAFGAFEFAGLLIETVSPVIGLALIFVLSAANTLAHARTALRKRQRELDTLVEIGRISASLVGGGVERRLQLLDAEDADALVPPLGSGVSSAAETVASTIRHVLGADVAVCYLASLETRELAIVAASGADVDDLPEEIVNTGGAAARLALRDRRPVLWRHGRRRPSAVSSGPNGSRPSAPCVTDLLCVPMTVGGRVGGAMVFFNKTASAVSPAPHFTPEDLRLVTTLTRQAAVTIENARLYQSMHGLFLDAIKSLAAAIDAKDPYTRGHTARVAHLCGFLGGQMALTSPELQVLHLAATLHDIGKIAIPEAVLNKPTDLTPEERRIVEKHPVRGAIILEPVRQLRPIIPGIRHHHERYDGTGYPDGLAGEAIPLLARVIAVADAFDAMTTDRPYRRALTEAEGIEEVGRCAGTQFDPHLAEVFIDNFPSARVLLAHGARA